MKRYARRLLRDAATKRWLTVKGTFTENVREALELRNFTEAHKICIREKRRRLELVLKFPNDEDDVILPMG